MSYCHAPSPLPWDDYRYGYGNRNIYGARVSQSGVVLDPAGIFISYAGAVQRFPAIAFDSINYLVLWEDARNFEFTGWDIYGARVGQDGTVLDPAGIAISTALLDETYPSVAFDGRNYLCVWSDGRNWYGDIYGARVNRSGFVLDPEGIAISTAPDYQEVPVLAFDGTNYLVVWEDDRDGWQVGSNIYGTRVDRSGSVLDPEGIPISIDYDSQKYPAVIFAGAHYLIVWEDGVWRVDSLDLYGAKVDTSGNVIDSFAVSTQSGNQASSAIAHGMSDSLFVVYSCWTDSINAQPARTMRIWGKFYPFVGVEEDVELNKQVGGLSLQIYPNPAIKACNIKYTLSRKTDVNISLYDVTGSLVKEIINEIQNGGIYIETIDVTGLPTGVYFIELDTSNCSDVKKVILIK